MNFKKTVACVAVAVVAAVGLSTSRVLPAAAANTFDYHDCPPVMGAPSVTQNGPTTSFTINAGSYGNWPGYAAIQYICTWPVNTSNYTIEARTLVSVDYGTGPQVSFNGWGCIRMYTLNRGVGVWGDNLCNNFANNNYPLYFTDNSNPYLYNAQVVADHTYVLPIDHNIGFGFDMNGSGLQTNSGTPLWGVNASVWS
jgi:hypothetical protein